MPQIWLLYSARPVNYSVKILEFVKNWLKLGKDVKNERIIEKNLENDRKTGLFDQELVSS